MRRLPLLLAPLLLAAALPLAGLARGEDAPAKPAELTIADVAWLAGTWTHDDGQGRFDEFWFPPAGGTMTGTSRQTKKEKTSMIELSSIEKDASGAWALHVRHFGAGLTPWKSEADGPLRLPLASHGAKEIAFEDPARAFPRRISYRAGADDTLEARVEGERGGKPFVLAFAFQRAK